jgi:hypothetical protein
MPASSSVVFVKGIPEAPRRMQPPEHATHHVWAPHIEKTPVDIDPDACARLDRALTSAPGHVGEQIARQPDLPSWHL